MKWWLYIFLRRFLIQTTSIGKGLFNISTIYINPAIMSFILYSSPFRSQYDSPLQRIFTICRTYRRHIPMAIFKIYRCYFNTDSYRQENRSSLKPERNRVADLKGPNQFLFGIDSDKAKSPAKDRYQWHDSAVSLSECRG